MVIHRTPTLKPCNYTGFFDIMIKILVVERLFYIWGHSYEFDRNNNWEHMEEICQKLSGNDEILYATNIETYDYVQAYKSLIYSANGYKVYNPTLYTIWIDVDSRLYAIKSGETVCIEK